MISLSRPQPHYRVYWSYVFLQQDGNTAAHLAARNGHIEVIEALKGKVSFRATSRKVGFMANVKSSKVFGSKLW